MGSATLLPKPLYRGLYRSKRMATEVKLQSCARTMGSREKLVHATIGLPEYTNRLGWEGC